MARIKGVSSSHAGPYVKIAYRQNGGMHACQLRCEPGQLRRA
ncbi:MAG: hypothetical protein ACLQDY_06450 [Streptosporangiaceae bacterium]